MTDRDDAVQPAAPDATIASDDDLDAEAAAEADRERRKPLTRRAIAVLGARGAGALVAVAVAAVAIGGATLVQGPQFRIEPPSTVVTPVPAAQQRLCPGPILRLGDESGQGATTASSVGPAASVFQADPDEAEATPLGTTENLAGVAPLLVTLPPQGDVTADPLLAGSQSQSVRVGDLVGFAAAECTEPNGDSWLVGGAADVGRSTLITISNPTTVIATVDLTIYAETGMVAAPGAEGIVVPPGAQRIFSLSGFAPGILRPVVRVESRGGQIVANLQQSVVRTLAPGGVELVAPGVGVTTSAVIPGLVVSGGEAVVEAQGQVGYDDLSTALRLLVPGDLGATATVTVTPQSSAAAETSPQAPAPAELAEPTTFTIGLRAGEVSDVPLTGLADGAYVVTVDSTEPVVAGVRSSVLTGGGASDLAWLPSAPPLAERTLVSIATGPGPALRLANDTDDDIAATVSTGEADIEVVIPAGGSVGIPVASRAGVEITADEGLRAAVTYLDGSGVSAFVVTPPGPASTAVLVYR